MDAKTFGYATPIDMENIKPGMMLAVGMSSGERGVGISFASSHDAGVIIFWSNRDGEIPRAESIDARFSYAAIEGTLELEPSGVQDAFHPPAKVGMDGGFVISSSGKVLLAAAVDYFGSPTRVLIDVETGRPPETKPGAISFLSDHRLFIRQKGRDERWPLIDLVP